MRAMILAAGRGERMRPLTDRCPKPLLQAGGRPLIAWHLLRLARAGIREVVINHAHLGEQLVAALGNGFGLGLSIAWSPEREALETAGGIANALPLLGDDTFLVINGDIWSDFDPGRARTIAAQMDAAGHSAWCVLVQNPEHHPAGDFGIHAGRLSNSAAPRHTFSGIGLYRPAFFAGIARGAHAPLGPMLRDAADAGSVGAEFHPGRWVDVGTPQRLAELDAQLRQEA